MGIDPGLANTGFGVLRVSGSRMTAIDGGTIETGSEVADEHRLRTIHDSLVELIGWHEPESVALESLYFGRNVRSALAVGQARGVIMLAAAAKELRCFDYTPQAVKLAVCGSGAAAKDQVKHMVGVLLKLPAEPPSDHAADALAVAICHAAHLQGAAALQSAPAVAEVPSPQAALQ